MMCASQGVGGRGALGVGGWGGGVGVVRSFPPASQLVVTCLKRMVSDVLSQGYVLQCADIRG
jgi:hypothetical protein